MLNIFVSSVGNDDDTDNESNNFASDIAKQHSRHIDEELPGLAVFILSIVIDNELYI